MSRFVWWHRIRRHRIKRYICLFGGHDKLECSCGDVWMEAW